MKSAGKEKNSAKKSAASPPISVGFISLGCAKNLVDSQIMAGELLAANMELAPCPEEADVVIVNTCAFIEEAREEAVDSILSACELKKTGKCRAVLVAGCLPQRYKAELAENLPEVDGFIGLDELSGVADIVKRLLYAEQPILRVSKTARKLFEPRFPSLVFTGGPYAYLKISEGCNHRCAFCAIPAIRGRYRSRPAAKIVKEAEHLVRSGYRELDLISQDVTGYGSDRRDGVDLSELLTKLGGISGDFWIRILYGYPTRVTDRLLETMSSLPRVCHYLDVPIQHSHPDILRAMRRAGTVKPVREMARRVRSVMPDVVLRTTCLVGYPGETEKHFQHLLDFIQEMGFDHVGAFVFSPEEGTEAETLPNRPSREVAEQRRERLLAAQQSIVHKKHAALVGLETRVLLEQPGETDTWLGRSCRFAPEVDGVVLVEDVPSTAGAGDFVRALYTASEEYNMRARCC